MIWRKRKKHKQLQKSVLDKFKLKFEQLSSEQKIKAPFKK